MGVEWVREGMHGGGVGEGGDAMVHIMNHPESPLFVMLSYFQLFQVRWLL